ncbi:protein FAR1-RELATED SEQUENCE 5-like [Rhododendron vialii]|uniref:protein FAR1-RELATED SEQUENCE 5-like n=1 Tax=Rhododendron vialii TaxID=182163 RepID=UPI00266025B5|nr:protein FAR1-RELATED SEQUENCE 5-like [Rhododendron vialii]
MCAINTHLVYKASKSEENGVLAHALHILKEEKSLNYTEEGTKKKKWNKNIFPMSIQPPRFHHHHREEYSLWMIYNYSHCHLLNRVRSLLIISEVLYTPQVKNEVIPKLTQQFKSLDDAKKFYNNYAFEAGFSMRIHSSKTDKNGETIRKENVCYKEGESKSSEATQRQRGLTREKCGAKLTVVKNRSGEGFVVTQFVEGHSHPLTTPKKVHFLRSHRRVSIAQKALTQQLAAANVSTSQQMSILELQAGSLENVGCLRRDIYNSQRDTRKYLDGHDANMLKEHFETEKEKNLGFTYTIEEDNEHRMTHCFWADATSRKSYQYFGDVVVFDTTYNTNKYSLIFSPLLGVNHHGQTTLFGYAFLSNEKSESFE